MAFVGYGDDYQKKISSSRIWRLKREIVCKDGVYEVGTPVTLEARFNTYDHETGTVEIVIKEVGSYFGHTYACKAQEFDNTFDPDPETSELLSKIERLHGEETTSLKWLFSGLVGAICIINGFFPPFFSEFDYVFGFVGIITLAVSLVYFISGTISETKRKRSLEKLETRFDEIKHGQEA